MSKKKDRNPLKKARKKQQKEASKRAPSTTNHEITFEKPNRDDDKILHLSYEVTWEPMIDEDTVLLSPEVEQLRADIYEQMNKPKPQMQAIVKQLEALCQQYPDDKTFSNYLAAAYLRNGEKVKGEQKIKDNFEARPNYLFARFQLAEIYIDDELFEKVKDLFEDKWDLKLLLPERDVFHISEVRSMLYIAARYAYWIDNQAWFNRCYETLTELDPDCSEITKLMQFVLTTRLRSMISARNVIR